METNKTSRTFSDVWNCVWVCDMKATRRLFGGKRRPSRKGGGKGGRGRAQTNDHGIGV